jgi:hypothetical protein
MTDRPQTHLIIRNIRLDIHLPPVSVNDLALMLELDLAFARRGDFRRRLRRALNDAARQGTRP